MRKIVAGEWLLFAVPTASALLIVVPFVVAVFGNQGATVSSFYGSLLDPDDSDFRLAWIIVVAPYVLAQLGRSVAWAARTAQD